MEQRPGRVWLKAFFVKILTANQLPYLVAVGFAAVGWGITHSVDRIVESPIVEVAEKTSTLPNGNKRLELKIENLSNSDVVREIELLIKFRKHDGNFYTDTLRMLPTPPAYVTQANPDILNRNNYNGMSQFFRIDMLHPGWKVRFLVDYMSDSHPIYQFRAAKNAMRVMEPSLATFFARNEQKILWGGILSIIAVFIWILAKIGIKQS